MNFKIFLLLTFLTTNTHAECLRGITAIFNNNTIEQLATSLTDDIKVRVGATCVEKYDYMPSTDQYCECIAQDKNTDFDKSRRIVRRNIGLKIKGEIFEFANYVNQVNSRYGKNDLTASCNLQGVLEASCKSDTLKEMFPDNDFKNGLDSAVVELKKEYKELYEGSDLKNSTIASYKTNSCSSLFNPELNLAESVTSETPRDEVEKMLGSLCEEFNQKVDVLCNQEPLEFSDKDKFEMDALSNPQIVDNYNYYCKIIDHKISKDIKFTNILQLLSQTYKNKRELDTSAVCNKVCEDKAPYTIHGCKMDIDAAMAELERLNCSDKENGNEECKFLKELLVDKVVKNSTTKALSDEDKAYLKANLSEEEYEKVVAYSYVAPTNFQGSLVNQFFGEEVPNEKTQQPQAKVIAKKETSQVSPVNETQAKMKPQPKNNMAMRGSQQHQQAPQATQQPQQLTQTEAPIRRGTLQMGSRSNRKVSKQAKEIVESIKALRKAGTSLEEALAERDRKKKEAADKLAAANAAKYQRYDAETLEPIGGFGQGSRSTASGNDFPANYASSGGGAGAGQGFGGAGGSGGTGSSTFAPPEKQATVVDITGRSAPNIDLNTLESSGATLPSSITNHPDASEISKMFNGLEYQKDQGRSIASKSDEIKKIKVKADIDSIDLGSLLITAKDIKPGDEFIIYKGDMKKFVKLVPAYRYRRGKRVFVGYRIENRSSKNADLAASLYAKKFLIL